jgi:glycerophosphoryl diester phosphodiesterase
MKSFLNIAHRGASGHAPENTLAAFKKAIQLDAHMIELDLHLSLDGQLMVIHDRSLKRTTGHPGSVNELPLRTLKTLDAGSWFDPCYRGEQIPTLQEVFDLVGDRVRLNIEIKKGFRTYQGLEEKLLGVLDRYKQSSSSLISSFDESVLQEIRRQDTRIPIGYLSERGTASQMIHRALKLGAVSVHGPAKVISEDLIRTAHGEGLQVYVYTVNALQEMRYWIEQGADGIFTNYPDRLASLLGDA